MIRNVSQAVAVIGFFTLSACGGDSGTPSPTVKMSISPVSVSVGQSATLSWSSTAASSCSAGGGEWAGPQPTSGSVVLTLSGAGTYTYTLSCSSGAGPAATGSASLTVTPPQLAIYTAALNNGLIGTPFNQTIQSTGGVAPFAWKVSSGALPHNLSLMPSTTDVVTIFGTPDTGAEGETFTIEVTDSAHNTATQPFTVSILLQTDSLVFSPAQLDFGSQILGSPSGVLTETLTNTASSPMALSSVAITPNQASNGGEFKQTSTTCGSSLAAGASCEIAMIFTPSQTGPRAAALKITDDTWGSPQSVGMGGVGLSTEPNATFSGASLVFGTQLTGSTSPAQALVLTNYGAIALNISSITTSSSFAETNNCVGGVPSLGICTIRVTFTPDGSGDVNGTLSIADDAAGSPQKVSLSGTGATMTPLLTGACFACSSRSSTQCPAGAPSEMPVLVPSQCGGCQLGVCGQVTVDHARPCSTPKPPYHGYCLAQ